MSADREDRAEQWDLRNEQYAEQEKDEAIRRNVEAKIEREAVAPEYQVIIDVVPVEVEGETEYHVQDHSRPGARMWPKSAGGPFRTEAEAITAADSYRKYVQQQIKKGR